MDLQGEGNGHADDEEEEGHDEIGEVAAVPRRVTDHRPLVAGAVHQYHQLQHAPKPALAHTEFAQTRGSLTS